MRNNLLTKLQKKKLTPKERILLLIHNKVSEEREGKSFLTKADKYALGKGWTPANDGEVKEYNRYNAGWRLVGNIELEAEVTFLQAKINNLEKKNFEVKITKESETSEIKKFFEEKRENLIDGYVKLLTFKELFKRLSKIYQIDLTYKINDWIKSVSGFIDKHNESWFVKFKMINETSGLILPIEKNKIQQNKEIVSTYYNEFKKLFGGEYF